VLTGIETGVKFYERKHHYVARKANATD